MRKFNIKNEYGETINLMGNSFFLYSPDGFGFAENIEYYESDGWFIETARQQSQVEKTAVLVFKPGDAYSNYFEFANWIFAAKELTFGYNPNDTWFYVDIDVVRMDKSEINANGLLEIPMVFAPKSPFYLAQTTNIEINGDISESGKVYTYTYPYIYTDTSRAGVAELNLQAQMPGDFSIRIPGAILAPVITAKNLSTGEVLGRVDLSSVYIPAGSVLSFSTVPKSAGAKIITGDVVEDLTNFINLDPNYKTFFKIPANANVEIAITAESLENVTAELRIYRYFRTV